MNRLLVALVAAIALAFGSVLVFQGQMAGVYWVGEFFLKSLKMMIVPLVICSMISGITGLGDVRRLGRLGGRTLAYYGLTTLMAVILGTVLVSLIRPGEGVAATGLSMPERVASKTDLGLSDIVLGFVSDNIVHAMANLEMLPIIVFSLAFGAVLTTTGEKGRPVIALFEGANEAMMKLVHLVMWIAPVGVFGLVAGRFGKAMAEGGAPAFYAQLSALGAYMATVLLGLALHAMVTLPLILYLTTRRSPLAYARALGSALLTAFSTASSAATLPLTIEGVERNAGVDPRAANFVLPLGATINMDGTALYEAVAVIFMAQALGVSLSPGQQILVVLTATLASIGAAGIPEAGLVTMVIVLRAVNLPLEGVGLILAVDWLLDRFRTAVNIWGDAVGAAVVERLALQGPTVEAEAPAT